MHWNKQIEYDLVRCREAKKRSRAELKKCENALTGCKKEMRRYEEEEAKRLKEERQGRFAFPPAPVELRPVVAVPADPSCESVVPEKFPKESGKCPTPIPASPTFPSFGLQDPSPPLPSSPKQPEPSGNTRRRLEQSERELKKKTEARKRSGEKLKASREKVDDHVKELQDKVAKLREADRQALEIGREGERIEKELRQDLEALRLCKDKTEAQKRVEKWNLKFQNLKQERKKKEDADAAISRIENGIHQDRGSIVKAIDTDERNIVEKELAIAAEWEQMEKHAELQKGERKDICTTRTRQKESWDEIEAIKPSVEATEREEIKDLLQEGIGALENSETELNESERALTDCIEGLKRLKKELATEKNRLKRDKAKIQKAKENVRSFEEEVCSRQAIHYIAASSSKGAPSGIASIVSDSVDVVECCPIENLDGPVQMEITKILGVSSIEELKSQLNQNSFIDQVPRETNNSKPPEQKSDTKRRADYTFPNAERDARILELRLEGASFPEIAAIINMEFPREMVNDKSAQRALKRYCTRINHPYPEGKRGRKPNW